MPWTEHDGLGALIISPTRELAVQIFEVLKKVGRNHPFSAGLVIGGKSLKEEAERIWRMNILVCTPGRMLQHLDQTFEARNLQVLVLDEADRIMDMGFQRDVDALVQHLPVERQTMMFSATQSRKVSDLARLSLKDPEYVSVHENASAATPTSLHQHYVVTPLPEKLNTLFGFIKSNSKSKMIVFLSSEKQVRFVYESFKHLRPGLQLFHLFGRQKLVARLAITEQFTRARHACLFATDVVARGVDFPAVDWVVQVDCPEDADTYIHRVGRTARFQSNGRAVLLLDPTEEEGFLKRLEHKKVPIQVVHVKDAKKRSIQQDLQQMCWKDQNLHYLAKKAFVCYAQSINWQRDKEVFKFNELDWDGFASSLGLPGAPQIKFRKGEDVKKLKNTPRVLLDSDSESEFEADGTRKKNLVKTKVDRMLARTNQDVFTSHRTKLLHQDVASDEDDENVLTVKRVIGRDGEESDGDDAKPMKTVNLGGKELIIDSKRREKLLKSKKKLAKLHAPDQRLVFDDDGKAHPIYELKDEEDFRQDGNAHEQRRKFLEMETERVKEADLDDKEAARELRKEKRLKRKMRDREEVGEEGGRTAVLEDEDDGQDPLELMRSMPIAGKAGSSSEDEGRPAKKTKKWFEDESEEDEGRKAAKPRRVIRVEHEPETLEDYEALAAGLLE